MHLYLKKIVSSHDNTKSLELATALIFEHVFLLDVNKFLYKL